LRLAAALAAVTLALAAAPALAGEDRTPPRVNLTGLNTCILSHTCFAYVESSESGRLLGEGRVLISGAPRRVFRFRTIRRAVRAQEEYELSFALRRPARRAVARALRRGRRVTAREKVTVTDAAGNRTVRRRTVPIVLS
jgi:hypothetical protein